MQLTVIKEDQSVKQILLGSPTEEIKTMVSQLNNNPLMSSNWTYEEVYSDKTMYQLAEFLLPSIFY